MATGTRGNNSRRRDVADLFTKAFAEVSKTVCAAYANRRCVYARHRRFLFAAASLFILLTTLTLLTPRGKHQCITPKNTTKCSTAQQLSQTTTALHLSQTTTARQLSQTTTVNYHSEKCSPFPLAVPPNASLFHCNTRWEIPPARNCTQRLQAKLACSKVSAEILYEWINVSDPPAIFDMEDNCLARVIANRCTTFGMIPRVVHYVSFNTRELSLHGLLSVFSAVRFAQPCLILFHINQMLTGHHWEALLRLVPNVIYIIRLPPTTIFGHVIKVVEHQADVARLEAMRKFGGIYSDLDHVVLRPIADLLNHSVVMGTEHPDPNFGNGFYMGKPRSAFFQLWYDSYRSFNDNEWGTHSTIVPYKIYKNITNLGIHVVDSFFRPNWRMIDALFYTQKYDWEKLYGIHLYYRFNKKYFLNVTIESIKGNLGQVTRHVLYGRKDACLTNRTDTTPVRWAGS